MPPADIVLIGYRAVGKSTIGARVAQRLGRPFIDLDAVLEADFGESIAALVARYGWPEFRRREKEVVRRLAGEGGLVIATGGGVVLDPENVHNLRAHGRLIWLQASPATIRARLEEEQGQVAMRPTLTGRGTLTEIEEVLAARSPLYAAAATVTLAVDNATPEELVDKILDLVKGWEQADAGISGNEP